jgi:hypothetical protein
MLGGQLHWQLLKLVSNLLLDKESICLPGNDVIIPGKYYTILQPDPVTDIISIALYMHTLLSSQYSTRGFPWIKTTKCGLPIL